MTENYEAYAVSGTSASESDWNWVESVPLPSYWGKQFSSTDAAFMRPEFAAHKYTPTPAMEIISPQLSESQFQQILDLLAKKMTSIIADDLIRSGKLEQMVAEEHVPAKSGRRIERV